MNEALMIWIKSGHKFPPSVADLIARYDDSMKQVATGVIAKMDEDGYFDDPEDSPRETAIWNYNNRIRKANMWSQSGNGPDWFMKDYQEYYNKLYQSQLTGPETKRLEHRR
jgi:hypothetical protein